MNKKKKILLIGGGIIGLLIAVFLYINTINNQYRNRIPEISDSSVLSSVLQQQISDGFKEAHRKPSAQNLGYLGMVYHSSANYKEAAQCYKLATEKSWSDWKWYYYLGYLNMELGNSDEVVINFKKVIEINPDIDLAWYYLAEAYRNLRKNDLAEEAFTEIINNNKTPAAKETTREDHFPLSVYAKFQLSKVYIETNRLELAEETLKELINQYDLFGPAYRLIGNIYNIKGDISQGEEFKVRANDLFVFFPPIDTLVDKLALMSRSELYLLKKIDEASRSYYSDWAFRLVDHGLEYMPDNEYLISKAIENYLWKNMNQEAISLVDQHISSFTNNYNELIKTGMLFFKKGLFDEAKKYFIKALKLKSENVEVYEKLAMCYWNTGDKQIAQKILIEAAEKNQDNPENLADIAFAISNTDNLEKASYYSKKLNQLSPQNPKVLKLAGKIAEKNGDVMAAITKYETSFKSNPKDAETINSLGDLFMRNKMWDRYINLFKEAIKYNPNNPGYLDKLSDFLLGCPDKSFRNLDEGLNYSKRAFIHNYSPPHIMLSSGKNLAVAYATKGDKENAIQTIKKTIEISQRTNASEDVKQELEQLYRAIQNR